MLKPSFVNPAMATRFPEIAWSVTAGNSSQITDGAAALLIMSEKTADTSVASPARASSPMTFAATTRC